MGVKLNVEELSELSAWSFPDTIQVPDGYDMTQIADMTRSNFQVLIDEHNKMVKLVNFLIGMNKPGE